MQDLNEAVVVGEINWMSDIATTGWFPVLTLLIGFATKSLTDWLDHRRTAKREREAREAVRGDQLFERRTGFQRETLLALQEASMQLARSVGQIQYLDEMAHRATGQWHKQLLPEDLSEANRLAQARTLMFGSRVRDNSIRELVEKFRSLCTKITFSPNLEDSNRAMLEQVEVYTELHRQIGVVLRNLDDAEEIGPT
jgi:hypothetical protein